MGKPLSECTKRCPQSVQKYLNQLTEVDMDALAKIKTRLHDEILALKESCSVSDDATEEGASENEITVLDEDVAVKEEPDEPAATTSSASTSSNKSLKSMLMAGPPKSAKSTTTSAAARKPRGGKATNPPSRARGKATTSGPVRKRKLDEPNGPSPVDDEDPFGDTEM